jgi:hypothetical protein
MMLRRLMACLGVLTLTLAMDSQAQSADEAAVIDVIRIMFDGMAEGDTAKMWSVIDRDTRLVQTLTQDGVPVARFVPMAGLIRGVGANTGEPFVEKWRDPVVHIADNLATIWISYTFYRGEQLSHCGEDTFQLARTTEGWKIVAAADTQRREGCGS